MAFYLPQEALKWIARGQVEVQLKQLSKTLLKAIQAGETELAVLVLAGDID